MVRLTVLGLRGFSTESAAPARIQRPVLYGTGAVGLLPGHFETIDDSKRHARQDGVRATARRIAATWFATGGQAEHDEACAQSAEATSPTAFDGGLDAMQGWSGVAELGDIAPNTLILWDDGDRTCPSSQSQLLWQTIPKASLAVLPMRCTWKNPI